MRGHKNAPKHRKSLNHKVIRKIAPPGKNSYCAEKIEIINAKMKPCVARAHASAPTPAGKILQPTKTHPCLAMNNTRRRNQKKIDMTRKKIETMTETDKCAINRLNP